MIIRRFVVQIAAKYQRAGFAQASKDLSKLRREVDGTARSFKKLNRSSRRGDRLLGRLSRSQRQEARAARRAARQNDRLASSLDRVNKASKRAGRGGRKLAGSAGGASKGLGGLLGKAKGLLGPLSAMAGGVLSAKAAIQGVIAPVLETGASMESLRAQLANLMGGQREGEKAFNFIRAFAAKTPFQIDQVTESFIKLQNQGITPTERRLTAFGDLAAANKKNLDQITEAVLDAAVGENERLKEFGIKGKVIGEQVQLSFRGTTLTVDKNREAITEAMVKFGQMDGVAGSMAAQMNTLTGAWSNAKDALTQFMDQAAQNGPLEAAKKGLGELREQFLTPENAKLLGEAITEVINIFREFFDMDAENFTMILRGVVGLIKVLAIALKPVVFAWQLLVKGLAVFGAGLETVAGILRTVGELLRGEIGLSDALSRGWERLSGRVRKLGSALGVIRDDEPATTGSLVEIANAMAGVEGATLGAGRAMGILAASAREALSDVKKAVQGAVETRTGGPEGNGTEVGSGGVWERKSAQELDMIAGGAIEANDSQRRRALVERNKRKNVVEQRDLEKSDKKRKKKAGRKGKSKTFFDFEKSIESEAETRAGEFAKKELARLMAEGGRTFEEAERTARESGQKRKAELIEQWKRLGKIPEKVGDGILDQLGLRGPGSILENRPPPQTLIINISPEIKMIERLELVIHGAPGQSIGDAVAEGGQRVARSLSDQLSVVESAFVRMLNLQADQLVAMGGGGRQLPGVAGG